MTQRRDRLIAKLGDRAGELAEYDGLERALAALVDAGTARLPHNPVPDDVFVERIADALLTGEGAVTVAQLERIQGADLYLACALAAKDARAVEVSEAELMTAVRQSAGRVDSTRAFVDEVSQRVRDRLLVGDGTSPPAITQYRGSGPLGRWVRVVASRIALDIKRADAKHTDDGEDALSQLPAPNDPELEVIWRTCAAEYKAALDQAFAGLSKRDRNLMRQRYLDDLNIDALGRIYRVNPSTAFRWLKQVEQKLAEATRAALMHKLSISESQVHSMERMVVSQLQLSLVRMLRGKPS
ncbi:MAG: transcriptional regulator [Deltaproteobacteria bacterium]|nr:transcriptional regulator [Deltaproteobacteria bacterium]